MARSASAAPQLSAAGVATGVTFLTPSAAQPESSEPPLLTPHSTERETSKVTASRATASASRHTIRVIAIGDFHGALDNAPAMAGEVRCLQADHERTIAVGTGDLIGWAQAESDITREEFALDVLGQLPLAASALGNHEFDDRMAELHRILDGGCHPVDGCFDRDGDGEPDDWAGAPFPYLAANVIDLRTGEQPFPGSVVVEVGGTSVGLIGTLTPTTPGHAGPEKFRGLAVEDIAEATNREAAELTAQGVRVLIAITHEGGWFTDDEVCTTPYGGPLHEAAEQISSEVDLIVGGHFHRESACTVPDPDGVERLAVQPGSHAAAVGVIDLVIDERTGDVDRTMSSAFIQRVDPTTPEDPDVRKIVDQAHAEAERVGSRVVGRVSGDILRPRDDEGNIAAAESELDNLVADAQLEWVNTHISSGADLAVTSNWMTRDDLLYARSGEEPKDGLVTRRELWNAQIYDPSMLVVRMTGEEIEAMFQEQWLGDPPLDRPTLGVSSNIRYVRDPQRTTVPGGANADRFVVDGELLDRQRTYRVAINSILARGIEDYFPIFAGIGLDRRDDTGVSTAVPLADYLTLHAPDADGLTGRMPAPEDLVGHLAEPTLTVPSTMRVGQSHEASVEVRAATPLDGPVFVEIAADPQLRLHPTPAKDCRQGRQITCVLDGLDGTTELTFTLRANASGREPARVRASVTGPFLERAGTTTAEVEVTRTGLVRRLGATRPAH